jgi:hypothetical protein
MEDASMSILRSETNEPKQMVNFQAGLSDVRKLDAIGRLLNKDRSKTIRALICDSYSVLIERRNGSKPADE